MTESMEDLARAAAEVVAVLRADGADDEETVALALDTEAPDFVQALEAAVDRLDELEAQAEAVRARIRRLQERLGVLEERRERVRDAVLAAMTEAGLDTVRLATATLSVRPGQPGVQVVDETAVPERYRKVKVTLDLAALRRALLAGEQVPGVALKNARPTLAVRRK